MFLKVCSNMRVTDTGLSRDAPIVHGRDIKPHGFGRPFHSPTTRRALSVPD